jgi:hypothetical protein
MCVAFPIEQHMHLSQKEAKVIREKAASACDIASYGSFQVGTRRRSRFNITRPWDSWCFAPRHPMNLHLHPIDQSTEEWVLKANSTIIRGTQISYPMTQPQKSLGLARRLLSVVHINQLDVLSLSALSCCPAILTTCDLESHNHTTAI